MLFRRASQAASESGVRGLTVGTGSVATVTREPLKRRSFGGGAFEGLFEGRLTRAEQRVELGLATVDHAALFAPREEIDDVVDQAVDHGDRQQGEQERERLPAHDD